jgi:hypothetical protein
VRGVRRLIVSDLGGRSIGTTVAGPTVSTVSGMHLLLAQGDPTGFSSPLGRVVVFVALATSLVLLLRWWWQQRRR